MKVIAKYPIILDSKDGKKVLVNNKYEGGFNNADGDGSTPAPQASGKRDWAKTISDVANSGIVQSGASIVNQIEAAKKTPQSPLGPVAGTGPSPVATGGPISPKDPAKKAGMSTGAKVGIAVGVVGLGVVIYMIAKHHIA